MLETWFSRLKDGRVVCLQGIGIIRPDQVPVGLAYDVLAGKFIYRVISPDVPARLSLPKRGKARRGILPDPQAA